ncbi:tRNA1(Val) (adenine(37)-N6)-methyltransferase [Bacillus sp. FSL W7-1360]
MGKLYEGERSDKIAGTTMSIIQSPDVFSYAMDAILLGRFVRVPSELGQMLDLCSGNGVVGLVLSTRTKGHITLLELQERLHHMAERNILVNQLQSRMTARCGDVRSVSAFVKKNGYDVVTCNPPYFPVHQGEYIKDNRHKALARHELACTLQDVIQASCFALKHGGKLALVHRPERLFEAMSLMRDNELEPKRIRFCHPHANRDANIVLVEAVKGGKAGLQCMPPLVVYEENGTYTKAFQKEYLCNLDM